MPNAFWHTVAPSHSHARSRPLWVCILAGGDKINSQMMRMRPEETQRWKDLVERNTESLRVVSGHLITKESSIFKDGLDEIKGKFHLLINNSMADNPDYWRCGDDRAITPTTIPQGLFSGIHTSVHEHERATNETLHADAFEP